VTSITERQASNKVNDVSGLPEKACLKKLRIPLLKLLNHLLDENWCKIYRFSFSFCFVFQLGFIIYTYFIHIADSSV